MQKKKRKDTGGPCVHPIHRIIYGNGFRLGFPIYSASLQHVSSMPPTQATSYPWQEIHVNYSSSHQPRQREMQCWTGCGQNVAKAEQTALEISLRPRRKAARAEEPFILLRKQWLWQVVFFFGIFPNLKHISRRHIVWLSCNARATWREANFLQLTAVRLRSSPFNKKALPKLRLSENCWKLTLKKPNEVG